MFTFHALFIALLSIVTANLSKVTITMDVAALVKRAQDGDSEAVSLLYEAYVKPIYRYCLYRINDPKDAEDLTSNVFLKMVEGLPAYRITAAPFAAWLFRIAQTQVADYYREHSRHPQDELPDMLVDDETLPEEIVLRSQADEVLKQALLQLSEEHQTILILRFVERRSHDDVAALLGKSVTAVKSAQHRALRQLSELLGMTQKARHYLRGVHE